MECKDITPGNAWPASPSDSRGLTLTDRHQTMGDRWLQGRLLPATLSLDAANSSKSWTIKENLFNRQTTTLRWSQWWWVATYHCLSRREGTRAQLGLGYIDLCNSRFCLKPPLYQCQRPPAPVWRQTRIHDCSHSLFPQWQAQYLMYTLSSLWLTRTTPQTWESHALVLAGEEKTLTACDKG